MKEEKITQFKNQIDILLDLRKNLDQDRDKALDFAKLYEGISKGYENTIKMINARVQALEGEIKKIENELNQIKKEIEEYGGEDLEKEESSEEISDEIENL